MTKEQRSNLLKAFNQRKRTTIANTLAGSTLDNLLNEIYGTSYSEIGEYSDQLIDPLDYGEGTKELSFKIFLKLMDSINGDDLNYE